MEENLFNLLTTAQPSPGLWPGWLGNIAAGQPFDVGEAGHGIETNEVVHHDVGCGGGTGTGAFLGASPREGRPLLQQALNLFQSGPHRGFRDRLGGLPVIASFGEAAKELAEMADHRLQGMEK